MKQWQRPFIKDFVFTAMGRECVGASSRCQQTQYERILLFLGLVQEKTHHAALLEMLLRFHDLHQSRKHLLLQLISLVASWQLKDPCDETHSGPAADALWASDGMELVARLPRHKFRIHKVLLQGNVLLQPDLGGLCRCCMCGGTLRKYSSHQRAWDLLLMGGAYDCTKQLL